MVWKTDPTTTYRGGPAFLIIWGLKIRWIFGCFLGRCSFDLWWGFIGFICGQDAIGGVRAFAVIVINPLPNTCLHFWACLRAVEIDAFIFRLRQRRSIIRLSIQRPRPSVEMRASFFQAATPRLHIFSPLCNTHQNSRRVGRVVMQRIANPCTPVRFRYPPPIKSMIY